MTSSEDPDSRDLFDGHGDYEHVGFSKAKTRIGVLIIGTLLLFAVISGMFLY